MAERPSENIAEILIIHASLYILAVKIHKTLCLFSLDISKLQHVVNFVRYVYERTPDLRTKIYGLRELLCHYIAANAKPTAEDTTYLALIEERGPFAREEACGTNVEAVRLSKDNTVPWLGRY